MLPPANTIAEENALESEFFTAAHLILREGLSAGLSEQLHRLSNLGASAVLFSAPESSTETAAKLAKARDLAADLDQGLDGLRGLGRFPKAA